jgi:hypothetical protein
VVAVRVCREPVVRREPRCEDPERRRPRRVVRAQQRVDAIGERAQRLAHQALEIAREQVVEPDVEDDPRVAPERRVERVARRDGRRVRVGVDVDRTMELHARAQPRRPRGVERAAHEIAEHAADDELGLG